MNIKKSYVGGNHGRRDQYYYSEYLLFKEQGMTNDISVGLVNAYLSKAGSRFYLQTAKVIYFDGATISQSANQSQRKVSIDGHQYKNVITIDQYILKTLSKVPVILKNKSVES